MTPDRLHMATIQALFNSAEVTAAREPAIDYVATGSMALVAIHHMGAAGTATDAELVAVMSCHDGHDGEWRGLFTIRRTADDADVPPMSYLVGEWVPQLPLRPEEPVRD